MILVSERTAAALREMGWTGELMVSTPLPEYEIRIGQSAIARAEHLATPCPRPAAKPPAD